MLARQDQKGIVTNITSFIYLDNGSIINLEQHIDTENRLFFYALGKVAISLSRNTNIVFMVFYCEISLIISNYR